MCAWGGGGDGGFERIGAGYLLHPLGMCSWGMAMGKGPLEGPPLGLL